MKSYVERLDKGETIERSLDEIDKERDEIVKKYRNLIKSEEDKKSFDDAYKTIRTIYRYAEDHLFWVEHWFHTIWFQKIRELGKLLVDNGMLNNVDDIFMFNRYEIPEMLTELSTSWALGINIPVRGEFYKAKAEKRKKILDAAKKWNPTPALGIPPEELRQRIVHAAHDRLVNDLANPKRIWECWKKLFRSVGQYVSDVDGLPHAHTYAGTLEPEEVA